MDNNGHILEALKYLDVASLSYDQWVQVGMALKHEGYDWTVWDEWSKADTRYKQGECERKWRSFGGTGKPVSGGTIVQMAKQRGYSPHPFEGDGCMDWNDVIEYDGDGVVYEAPKTMSPAEQLIKFLQTLFKPDELVGYVASDVWQDGEGKWLPSKGVCDRTAGELIAAIRKHPDDIGAVIGDWKKECGAWVRFNPLDGKGVKNENVTRFGYALVESDSMSVPEQDAIYRKLELPIATLTHSGGKSLHAIVKVDAENYDEYRKRVDFLYEYLEKNGLKVDKQNRNPSRLSRMPGVTRNGQMQTLIATDIGRASWNDWMDFVEGDCDGLPPVVRLSEVYENPPPLAPVLLDGVVRVGHKLLFSGASKSGKSFILIELAIDIAEGIKFWGKATRQGKVLYLNLEIAAASCFKRFLDIYAKLEIRKPHLDNLHIWNLRGKAIPLDKLVPKIIRRAKNEEYSAIIIDPIYKVIMGDENNASEMAAFCNQFDKICDETGASVIYAHHHSKGAQGGKIAQDRSSGSGVFARDPDAIIDLIELELNENTKAMYLDSPTDTAWRAEFITREFARPAPVNLWFRYPIHELDTTGILDGSFSRGDPKGNLTKSGKRQQTPEMRKDEFDRAFDICKCEKDDCALSDIAEYLDISERTVRTRASEFEGEYEVVKGRIRRLKKPQ